MGLPPALSVEISTMDSPGPSLRLIDRVRQCCQIAAHYDPVLVDYCEILRVAESAPEGRRICRTNRDGTHPPNQWHATDHARLAS